MTDTDTDGRLERLRMARQHIVAKLDDPKTPAYSVAPLTNQLRLTDKEIDRLTRATAEEDDGLPTTPDRAGFVDFLGYRRHLRRRGLGQPPHDRRGRANEWRERQLAIFESWHAAGFVPPPLTTLGRDDIPHAEAQEIRAAWVEECRAELARCLGLEEVTPWRKHHE